MFEFWCVNVGQVRASIDYHLWTNQHQIGVSSLFIHALGLVPYKDTFWTTRVQPDNKYSSLIISRSSYVYSNLVIDCLLSCRDV